MLIGACGDFTQNLWNESGELFYSISHSGFYSRMADGSLRRSTFRDYLEQDILYLEDDARAIKITAGKADSAAGRDFLYDIYDAGIELERSLHRMLLVKFDLNPGKTRNPACSAYCRHLLRTAAELSWEESAAALLPCYWIYQNAGIKASQRSAAGNPYQSWLDTYSQKEFSAYTERFISLCEQIAAGSDNGMRIKMTEAFMKSVRCELDFLLAFDY